MFEFKVHYPYENNRDVEVWRDRIEGRLWLSSGNIKGATMRKWFQENIEDWKWDSRLEIIYFKNQDDKVKFILRWL